jgi:hypothetical protein
MAERTRHPPASKSANSRRFMAISTNDSGHLGADDILAHLADQLVPADLARFRPVPSRG